MNPAEVAYQQVLAAWIAAGAAVVQAVGAIAAIIVSIQLARSSARREHEAEVAATRRLEAADQAQRERDAAADRALEARTLREKTEAHNGLIQRVTSLALLATDQCRTELDQTRSRCSGNMKRVRGEAFTSSRLTELRQALPEIKKDTGDVELLEAISVLQDQITPEKIDVVGGSNYVAELEAKLKRMFDAMAEIEALRR